MENQFKKGKLKTLCCYIVVTWTIVIIISAYNDLNNLNNFFLSVAESQLKVSYEKDLIYRKWASNHGGIYVPITDSTPPNPALSNIAERDITTPSGVELTLINPAYMTRQVHELGNLNYPLKGKITSLKPINKINMPDPWEKKTLELFDEGLDEYTELLDIDGTKKLRFMKALITEESCLKCHGSQGYKVGDIRGGISVSMELSNFNQELSTNIKSVIINHTIIWFIVLILFLMMFYKLISNEKSQEYYTKKLIIEQNNLSTTLKSIGEGVIVTDLKGLITRINSTALNLIAVTEIEALGHNIGSIYKISEGKSENKILEIISKVIMEKKTTSISSSYILQSKTNQRYNVVSTCSAIELKDKGCIGTIIVFRDMTYQVEMRKKMLQSEKFDTIGQLTSGIAHDFNNMLGGIIGGTELLLTHLKNDEKSFKYLQLIHQSGIRASELTKLLLTFSKTQNIELNPVDIKKIALEVISIVVKNKAENIFFETVFNSSNNIVLGDKSLIHNLFLNLFINSIHALPNGGKIICNFENIIHNNNSTYIGLPYGEYLNIEISDTGLGIPADILPKIFDPFFTTKQLNKGTGLGLSSVYSTINKLKGSITVSSEVNQGTTFNILLPVSKQNLQENLIQPTVKGHGLMLVIDDDEIQRNIAKDLLSELGYKVVLASDGYEGIQKYRDNREEINLVLLDMIMPGMNGLECFKLLKDIDLDVKVLVTSGCCKDDDLNKLKELGCNDFISKPYSLNILSKSISSILNN